MLRARQQPGNVAVSEADGPGVSAARLSAGHVRLP